MTSKVVEGASTAVPARVEVAEFQVWRTTFRVTAPAPAIAHLHRLCCHFVTNAGPDGVAAIEIEVRPEDDAWAIVEGGRVRARRHSHYSAASQVEWRMVRIAARAEPPAGYHYVHWHAAALRRGDSTVLLAGGVRSGKTTLALALAVASEGFELLGEDVVFMDAATREVHPFRRSPVVREGTLERLREVGYSPDPALHLGRHLLPEAIEAWAEEPSPLTHVISVGWDAEGPPLTAPMSDAEAAIELRERSHTLLRAEDAAWDTLREVLAPVRCYRLLGGADLRANMEAVRGLLDH